jgi:hypothetical protein
MCLKGDLHLRVAVTSGLVSTLQDWPCHLERYFNELRKLKSDLGGRAKAQTCVCFLAGFEVSNPSLVFVVCFTGVGLCDIIKFFSEMKNSWNDL